MPLPRGAALGRSAFRRRPSSVTFRLLQQAVPAAGAAVKSLWKGVRLSEKALGKAFLQKGFPQ